jgi:hypothetical protein
LFGDIERRSLAAFGARAASFQPIVRKEFDVRAERVFADRA